MNEPWCLVVKSREDIQLSSIEADHLQHMCIIMNSLSVQLVFFFYHSSTDIHTPRLNPFSIGF